jgi:hypothetical protein
VLLTVHLQPGVEHPVCMARNQELNMYAGKKMIERRNDDRQTYFGKIFFATRTRLYEGDLLNYSKAGLFIKSHALLAGKIDKTNYKSKKF